jgi:hypothetical protein
MTNSFAARHSSGANAIAAIATAGNTKILRTPLRMMVDYKMRPGRVLVP